MALAIQRPSQDFETNQKTDEYDLGRKPMPGLYITATPIGNLQDISLRALEVMRVADVVACEDTRRTGRLLKHFGIKRRLLAYHEHNELRTTPRLVRCLVQGKIVVLVSNAGTPLISDPGYRLVSSARDNHLMVTVLPGASAVTSALVVSGLPINQFFFAGFLPSRRGQRRKAIAEFAHITVTLVLFEAPNRLPSSLVDLAKGLGAREAAVVRELTKMHEEVRRGSLNELVEYYGDNGPPKGEVVVVIGPPSNEGRTWESDAIDSELRRVLCSMSPSRAAAKVATKTGVSRRVLYRRALSFTRDVET